MHFQIGQGVSNLTHILHAHKYSTSTSFLQYTFQDRYHSQYSHTNYHTTSLTQIIRTLEKRRLGDMPNLPLHNLLPTRH